VVKLLDYAWLLSYRIGVLSQPKAWIDINLGCLVELIAVLFARANGPKSFCISILSIQQPKYASDL